MWNCTTEASADRQTIRHVVFRDEVPAMYADAIDGWRANMDFRTALNGGLAAATTRDRI